MFYSNFIFVKKGPLAKVWIAAHFQRKLNKAHVTDTNIKISAESIADPTVALALRLSGQLLLGLVRIYSKKVQYLQDDCSDAMTKMKVVTKPGAVDLPAQQEGSSKGIDVPLNDAPVLPEIALDDLDDLIINVSEVKVGSNNSSKASVARSNNSEITLSQRSNFGVDFDHDDILMGEGKNDDAQEINFDLGDALNFDDAHSKSSDSIEVGRNVSGPSPGFLQSPGLALNVSSKLNLSDGKNISNDISHISFDHDDIVAPEVGPENLASAENDVPAPTQEVDIEEKLAKAEKRKEKVKEKVIKKRKVQVIPVDDKTELSSAFLSEGLKEGGQRDITLTSRPSMFKRARLNDPDAVDFLYSQNDSNSLVDDPAEFFRKKMSQSFVDPLYRDPSALAPELASLLSRMLVRGPPAGVALSKANPCV